MADNTAYSFTFLADQDRILLWFRSDGADVPGPVLLTRRMTRILGAYLRKALEKISELPDHVNEADRHEYMQFFHDQEVEAAPPQWTSDRPAPVPSSDEADFCLVTRIDTRETERHLVLSCFDGERFLVTLTLDWKTVHRFLHSLAQMALMADWGLDDELNWKVPWAGSGNIRSDQIN